MVAFGGKLLLAMYGSHSGASRLSAVCMAVVRLLEGPLSEVPLYPYQPFLFVCLTVLFLCINIMYNYIYIYIYIYIILYFTVYLSH